MKIEISPVAFVKNSRIEIADDNWGNVVSEIELAEDIPDGSLDGLSDFSHVEIIYYFHKTEAEVIEYINRHPRGNSLWPAVGIFAQRAKSRPNHLGVTMAKIVEIKERTLIVTGLDAINSTPVLDIKPVMKEFLPAGKITQPDWSVELMKNYWQ